MGTHLGMRLGNSQENFQLHNLTVSENIANDFEGRGYILTHSVHVYTT